MTHQYRWFVVVAGLAWMLLGISQVGYAAVVGDECIFGAFGFAPDSCEPGCKCISSNQGGVCSAATFGGFPSCEDEDDCTMGICIFPAKCQWQTSRHNLVSGMNALRE